MISWKGVGIAAGIAGGVIVGAYNATRAQLREPSVELTVDDISAVRGELREMQSDSNRRFEKLDQRLSHLEGYVAGKDSSK